MRKWGRQMKDGEGIAARGPRGGPGKRRCSRLEALLLQQGLGHTLQLVAVVRQRRAAALVALVDDAPDLLVDLVGDLLAVVAALHQVPPQEDRAVALTQ